MRELQTCPSLLAAHAPRIAKGWPNPCWVGPALPPPHPRPNAACRWHRPAGGSLRQVALVAVQVHVLATPTLTPQTGNDQPGSPAYLLGPATPVPVAIGGKVQRAHRGRQGHLLGPPRRLNDRRRVVQVNACRPNIVGVAPLGGLPRSVVTGARPRALRATCCVCSQCSETHPLGPPGHSQPHQGGANQDPIAQPALHWEVAP